MTKPAPLPTRLSPALDAAIVSAMVHEVAVFAADPSTKRPLPGLMWKQEATTAYDRLVHMWQRDPEAMVAMPVGRGSGSYVIDVDPRNGGFEALAKLEAELGPLPRDTPRATTAGGGLHVHLRWAEGTPIPKTNALGPGIDLIGCTAEGNPLGYVIMPGSARADGRTYEWETPFNGYRDALKMAPAAWTACIAAIVAQRDEHVRKAKEQLQAVKGQSGDPLNDAYARAALENEAKALAETPESAGEHGGRNNGLNVAAVKLGGLAPHRLSVGEIEAGLVDACVKNGLISDHGESAFRDTFASGLLHGMKTPRWEGAPGGAGQAADIDRLARLSPLDYDRTRSESAERMGVRVGTLDAEVTRRRHDLQTEAEKTTFLKEPMPWCEPVDGEELIRELVATLTRYVALPRHGAEAIALWALHAHAHDAAAISPTLALESPDKRCGKTTALNVIAELVPKPLPTSNITAASLFRAVQAFRPTLLIDEADTFLEDNDELRGILRGDNQVERAASIRMRLRRGWADGGRA